MEIKKLGMRNVKTGIGVGLSVLSGAFFVQNPLFTALACMVSIKDSVRGSLLAGLSRIIGTIIGGITGYLFALIGGTGNAVICTLGIITTIYICNHFDLKDEISIACVTFMAIHIGNIDTSLVSYSVNRVVDTAFGVIIGVIVNYSLARPKHTNNIHADLLSIEHIVSQYLDYKILHKKSNYNPELLEETMSKLDRSYQCFTNEFTHLQESECESSSQIDNLVVLSKELYFHIHSIEMLEQALYLNNSNYNKLAYLYGLETLDWEINDDKSPVFNYHLKRIIKQINLLRVGIDTQFEDIEHEPIHVSIKKA